MRQYGGDFGQVNSIEFINSGSEMVTCSDITQRNSIDKAILVFDFQTGGLMSNQIYQEGFTCTCLKKHPGGHQFMAQSNGNYIAIFSTTSPFKLNKSKRFSGHLVSGYNISFSVSRDGNIVASGSSNGLMYFYGWNSANGQILSTLKAHSHPCVDVQFHPILPTTLASCSWEGEIKIWV
eukprot:TRINITY_DN2774_c0_g1_i7.p2 TRINITY_DN2774_c0_g1~~TRINITY_DN2774_c0_g1_i7.p2  ORF type:complete len:179 (-),score=36.81 TRINITY_DN2774_c0_g1_i7:81-617(-)